MHKDDRSGILEKEQREEKAKTERGSDADPNPIVIGTSGIPEEPQERRRNSERKRERNLPWLVGNRRFSPNKRMPRSRQIKRNMARTRKQQPKQPSCSHVPCAGHRCLTQRHSNSTLRANIPSRRCLLSWLMCSREAMLDDLDTFLTEMENEKTNDDDLESEQPGLIL
ncbi:hypothetical protein NDU88_002145 [Pleurodeles waltl]|uniref:Uncharacterized protein n=1 Tax=Pleurodeles waltl TaxID=8319 RepID=A0AAV7TKC6_PLEWA|nr:hypothetical protein NDU88_002145 [Pleurodeles waltl]